MDREFRAAEAILPENTEFRFWHAVYLVNADRLDQGLPFFAQAFREGPNWISFVRGLATAGFMIANETTMQRIMTMAPRQ